MKLFGKSHTAPTVGYDVIKSDEDWRRQVSPEQFSVMFEHATERPGTSPLLHEKRQGTFVCAACGTPAYEMGTKFESGTGWPSFWAPIEGATATDTFSWCGWRCIAPHAAPIRATSSKTGRRRPASAIASMAPR